MSAAARRNTASSIVGREPAGERVLLARVERAEHGDRAARHFEQVREPRPARRELDAEQRGARAAPTTSPRSRTRRARRSPAPGRAARARGRRYGVHSSRSAGVGLFAGGAQRTAAATYASRSASPSSTAVDVGWFAKPHAVQRREQEVAGPVAGEHPAGAVPAVRGGREADDQHRARAGRRSRAPGRPQYVSSRNDARLSRATCSRHSTSRGHARHATISRGERGEIAGTARAAHEPTGRDGEPTDTLPARCACCCSSTRPRRRSRRASASMIRKILAAAARGRGRRDVAPRPRDPARARRRRTTTSTSSWCSRATAR